MEIGKNFENSILRNETAKFFKLGLLRAVWMIALRWSLGFFTWHGIDTRRIYTAVISSPTILDSRIISSI